MSKHVLVNGEWKKLNNTAYNSLPVGSIFPFAGTKAPYGALVCDGTAISRITYAKLFSIIGTRYGEGDGETTFNLPNLNISNITEPVESTIIYPNGGSAEAPANVTTNQQYVMDNPYQGYFVQCEVQIQHNNKWGNPEWFDIYTSSTQYSGVKANQLLPDDIIVVQTAHDKVMASSSDCGNPFGITSSVSTALPCRVIVTKLGKIDEEVHVQSINITCIKAFDTIAEETQINLAHEIEILKHSIYRKYNTPYIANGLPISDKTTITLQPMTLLINDHIRESNIPVTLELNSFDTADNRKGRDIKVYVRWNNGQLEFKLGYTIPEGFTEANSLLIGGFHCECADVGTIANHLLSGWLAGDILPLSIWDMIHRPVSSPDGMVFDSGYLCWYDIYLQSGTLENTKSVFNANTTRSRTQSGHELDMLSVNKRLLTSSEFTKMSLGSNQKTAIQGSKEYANTGGHVDTAGRRMISNMGCEDACGLLWQWLDDLAYMNHSTRPSADTTTNMGGEWDTNALVAGGDWGNSVSCGSAARCTADSRLCVGAKFGGRGRSACKSTY